MPVRVDFHGDANDRRVDVHGDALCCVLFMLMLFLLVMLVMLLLLMLVMLVMMLIRTSRIDHNGDGVDVVHDADNDIEDGP